jgi:rSAM/selenodomain-associated transferase 2
MIRLSVIIPTLNEAALIAEQLRWTSELPGVNEVVVVDGGSEDATREQVALVPRVRLVNSARGRANQLNAGAAAATGDVLLFLHADVRLPYDASVHVERALTRPDVVGGAFKTWTVSERPTWLAPWLHLADLRSRYSALPYGDQAMFVRRSSFEAVGGFPAQPLMEDLELSRKLSAMGRLKTVPAVVRVSGRRFVARPVFFTVVVNVFPALYRLGVSAERLSKLYAQVR